MSAPESDESGKSLGKLKEMAIRGKEYREDYELDMFGEEVVVQIRALPDKKFLPIVAFLKTHLGMDEDEAIEEIERAKAEAEDGEPIDVSKMDEEFVGAMQRAAALGVTGSYEDDGELVEYDDDEAEEMIAWLVGGYSVEIGGKVLEIAGDVRDAEKFRGFRGRK